MRISDWSSDVCSSDLLVIGNPAAVVEDRRDGNRAPGRWHRRHVAPDRCIQHKLPRIDQTERRDGGDMLADRKSVVKGKSVSVSVDLGGRLIIQKKKNRSHRSTTMYTT